MEIDKKIKDIEKDFSEGIIETVLYGHKDVNELNEIKNKLEDKGYRCNISHETYIHKSCWPYQMIINKPLKLAN